MTDNITTDGQHMSAEAQNVTGGVQNMTGEVQNMTVEARIMSAGSTESPRRDMADCNTAMSNFESEPLTHEVFRPYESTIGDIAEVTGKRPVEVSDNEKLHLIENRVPESSFKFPPKEYKDKSEKGGSKRRYCQREWFQAHTYLSYSKSTNGLYCLCFVLFCFPLPQAGPAGHRS